MQMLLELGRRWHLIMVHLQCNKMIVDPATGRWHLIICNVSYISMSKNTVRMQIG